MRSIEHSHTIVKILQNVVFTSLAVMMTLNKIDEIAPSPRNFVLLKVPLVPRFSQVGLSSHIPHISLCQY